MFWGEFWPGLEGYEEIKNPDPDIFRMYLPDIAAFQEENFKPGESMICVGKIKHVGSTYIKQLEYLKSRVPKERHHELKLTLAAPNWYHLRYKEGRAYPKDVYANDKEFFADVAKAYQAELQELYDHGLRNLQIDDPNLACKSCSKHNRNASVYFIYQSLTIADPFLPYRLLLGAHARRLEEGPHQH